MSTVTYRGQRRDGAGVVGSLATDASVCDFVEKCYRQGWRWLEVEQGDVQLGRILRDPDRPELHRIWWAELPREAS